MALIVHHKRSYECPLKGRADIVIQGREVRFDPTDQLLRPVVRYVLLAELLLTTVGTSNARRLCPLDTNLPQCPNSPGTEELPR